MIAALTWMSHSQNLRRMAREHPIDLYMQPPVTRFRLLDYHLMDRIVRDSNRCASYTHKPQGCFFCTAARMYMAPIDRRLEVSKHALDLRYCPAYIVGIIRAPSHLNFTTGPDPRWWHCV